MSQKLFCSVATLAFCGAIFADGSPANTPPYQGDILTDNRYPPAYNAPAKIDLQNRKNTKLPNDIFIDTSFIYWNASQDGMELAASYDIASGQVLEFNKESVDLIQPFTYSPGFKVGIGMGFQDWELHAEYTWIRHNSTVSSNAPTNHSLGGAVTPVWVIDPWFSQGIDDNYVSATHISSAWKLGIDLADLTAGRPYYLSKIVTISPFGGIRAAWIRQKLHIQATVPAAASSEALVPQPINSCNYSNSWGIGPVFGLGGHCLLGLGFRLEGDGGVSLLFTQYPTQSHTENFATGDPYPRAASVFKNYNCLRPMANLGLGLGWGRYLNDNKYHLDLAADYDFNIFWNQNMLQRTAAESILRPTTFNNLYLHGLTITGRFDF